MLTPAQLSLPVRCCQWQLKSVGWLCRQHRGVAGASAASATSTEDSQGSRPKRALQRFDYNVLNGTSASLNAMLQAAGGRLPSAFTLNLSGGCARMPLGCS